MGKKRNNFLFSIATLFVAIIFFHSSILSTIESYTKSFTEIYLANIELVGGKNASLGQMINELSSKGVRVPNGFAITTDAYKHYLAYNNLTDTIKQLLTQLTNSQDLEMLQRIGKKIRKSIEQGSIPEDLEKEIKQAYKTLSQQYQEEYCDVAVRSSATAEDLETASFAGQQDTFLHVHSVNQLFTCYKKCIASLFNDRAIAYRIEQGFDHLDVNLSVGVQKMIRSDLACSGVAFSADTETGFENAILINASYGLGESIVQGIVNPDEFIVHKLKLSQGFRPIIKKKLGSKQTKMVYSTAPNTLTTIIPVFKNEQSQFCLTDNEILELASMVTIIENHYSQLNKKPYMPMDIEWAKDGIDGQIYILQARPETVHAAKQKNIIKTYELAADREELKKKLLITGISVGQHIVTGTARVITDINAAVDIKPTEIIITDMTDPTWVPAMKKAAGIITNKGGRTCHAAIVGRELGIPVITGTESGTMAIQDGQKITLDSSGGAVGYIYKGHIPFTVTEFSLDEIPTPPVPITVNLGDPDSAFKVGLLPTSGVGLARLEFIISNTLKIHPMALIHPEKITDQATKTEINNITAAYEDKKQYFIEQLAHNVGMITAAFYPRPVIVRLSDFKSNEYRDLVGGIYFEQNEENPMIGFRGASRYYHPRYREAFALECAAMKIVRETMGFDNLKIMIPFVRTIAEAKKVHAEMKKNGLERGIDGLE
ncbi:MAG: phosphoenolpyruvate synthase, partial [Candidatus Babeliales bacterium]